MCTDYTYLCVSVYGRLLSHLSDVIVVRKYNYVELAPVFLPVRHVSYYIQTFKKKFYYR